MIKLVASDLDGTLLLHKAQSLPEEIFSLIRQLEELGIMFVAASGRQYPNMTKLFAPVASEISYISENGALAVDHGEVLYQDSFDRKLAGEIISAILEKKDAEFTCSAKDYHYLMPKTKRFHDHMLYEVKNECRFVNSMEEMTAPIMKLAVFEPAGLTEESVKYWMDRFGKECVVVTSGNEWIDFIPFGTNKAKGIREYQKRYHISPEECIAFGDEYNDIEMLKAVKYGFAMEHSKEGVRAATSYMTKQVEPVLENQEQLFPQAVAESYEAAEAFLEDCMAQVVDSIEEVREYLEESGADVEGMSDEELEDASEVFALPDGKYLIVEG